MKADALDLLFPIVSAEVLRALLIDSRREMYVREIARAAELAPRTAQRELAILKKIRLVTSRSNGFHVFYRAEHAELLSFPPHKFATHRSTCLLLILYE